MYISILTLFPQMFDGPFAHSIVSRAVSKKSVTISFYNIRSYATDTYGSVDDHPYGGGPGMILRADIIDRAIEDIKNTHQARKTKTILLDPQGARYTQQKAKKLSTVEHLILICGHYEGVDERIRDFVDEELSIGDYILTGGEIPAMVVVDSIVRLIPGVLSKKDATESESFTKNVLEYPQYTRPKKYKGILVPNVLVSGNHSAIAQWKNEQSRSRTNSRRPDLVKKSKD